MAKIFGRSAPEAIPLPSRDVTVDIAPMQRRHVRAVSAIEHRVFPRPWSPAIYLSELSIPRTRAYYVASAKGAVVGFAGCMHVISEAHVTTIGVAPEWHRRGVAMKLLYRLVCDARLKGATALTLEVRVSNVGAQSLYHSFGFVPAGIRKNYYPEVNEDGLVMWAHDIDSAAYTERLQGIAQRIDRAGQVDKGKT